MVVGGCLVGVPWPRLRLLMRRPFAEEGNMSSVEDMARTAATHDDAKEPTGKAHAIDLLH